MLWTHTAQSSGSVSILCFTQKLLSMNSLVALESSKAIVDKEDSDVVDVSSTLRHKDQGA